MVTREGTRPLAAFIAVVLAAALLAACGSSDSSSSSSTSTESPSGGSTTAQSNRQGGSSEKGNGQSGEDQGQNGGQPQSHQGGSSGKSVGEVETPLKVSGGGSAQFRSKGGDNSIQEFGGESDESELQEAAEMVHGFFVSRAAEEWDKACSYLAKSNIEQLEQLAAKSRGADCATVLKAFTRPLPAAADREITTVDAGSLRREGEQGFLIYYGAGHVTFAMPLRDEGGTWKVAALSGTSLG